MLIVGTYATGSGQPPLILFTSDPIGSYATTTPKR